MQVRGQNITGWAVGLALLASTAGFIFGYDTGQISGFIIMPDFLRRFGICEDPANATPDTCKIPVWREGTIIALLSVGTLFGALIGAPFADRLGRRYAMSLECFIFVLGVVVQVVTFNEWRQLAIGRFISGIGVGALSAAAPMYQAETAPKAIRGTLGATYQLFITLGILVAACINLGTNQFSPGSAAWRVPIALGVLFAAFLGIGILFMPESPRWLESHGKAEQAQAAVSKLHGVKRAGDDVAARAQYEEIRKAVAEEKQRSKATWADCFRVANKTRYRTLLGMSLQAFQQLTGANYFFYFGAQLFLGVGISNSFATQIILNSVNVICTFLGLYVMERFGRRRPLIIGGIWQAAWLFVFASVGTAKDPQTDATTAKVMICSACFFILGYASTWAPGVWILIGETFATGTRAKQAAISTASNWFLNFLIAFFTSPITANIGYSYGYIFAACNLVGSIIVYLFLYDSAALSLEDINYMYNSKDVNPRNSRKWAPPGCRTRFEKSTEHDDAETVVDSDDSTNGKSNLKEGKATTIHQEHIDTPRTQV